MKFISTRGKEEVTGLQAILQGVAKDGGLYVPQTFPTITQEGLEELSALGYAERVAKILCLYFDELDPAKTVTACEALYGSFRGDPAPVVRLDGDIYVLELFRGQTCAFTDMTVGLLPYLFEQASPNLKNGLILVATAGDEGKSAMESFKNTAYKVMSVYPEECVSKMQKHQIVTQEGDNVSVLGLKTNLDGCMRAVKNMLIKGVQGATVLSANDFNVAVIVAQIAFYFSAYCDMLSGGQIEKGELVDFVIPTGNFGLGIACYYAQKMGLPIRFIHVANNENKALANFFAKGSYDMTGDFYETISPCMDVLLPTNLERLLFEVTGRNTAVTSSYVQAMEKDGKFNVGTGEYQALAKLFVGAFADEEAVVEAVYDLFCDIGYTLDMHAGCCMSVVNTFKHKNKKDTGKMVIVAPLNPYKLPQDVLYAVTGNDVKDSFKGIKRLHAATAMEVPKCLFELRDRPARFTTTVKVDKFEEQVDAFFQG